MSYPLASVVETITTHAWTYELSTSTNQIELVKSTDTYALAIKVTTQLPRNVNVKNGTRLANFYNCFVVKPVITLETLDKIEGFGNEAIDYFIIDRNQSLLKTINRVFGVRCLLYRLFD